MRLINTRTLDLEEFEGQDVPSYAILSHRWGKDEVLYKHMTTGTAKQRRGFDKIRRCCLEAETFGLDYVWVDTCCIDKSSSAELSEAINSMFKWYQKSFLCLVYLPDVDRSSDYGDTAFKNSVWFTRGWTLQELIAPRTIEFYDSRWLSMGDLDDLRDQIVKITSIPPDVLAHKWPLRRYPIAQRLSWAAERQTTRVEDRAYSLMGLFDINMPMLYGEGENAFRRLQEEIVRRYSDTSILFWTGGPLAPFATSPSAFNVFDRLGIELPRAEDPETFGGWYSLTSDDLGLNGINTESSTVTNLGLSLSMPLLPWFFNMYLGLVAVVSPRYQSERYCFIYLSRTPHSPQLFRTTWKGEYVKCVPRTNFVDLYGHYEFNQVSLYVRQVVIASEPHLALPTQIYEHHVPGTVTFHFEKSPVWGEHGSPHATDIITRNIWDAENPSLLPVAPCELLAIFKVVKVSGENAYLYVGYDKEFRLCLALGAWSWPYDAYGAFSSLLEQGISDFVLPKVLQPGTFWSWFQGRHTEPIEWTIRTDPKPASMTVRLLESLGMWVRIEYSAIGSYTVLFRLNRSTSAAQKPGISRESSVHSDIVSVMSSMEGDHGNLTSRRDKSTRTD